MGVIEARAWHRVAGADPPTWTDLDGMASSAAPSLASANASGLGSRGRHPGRIVTVYERGDNQPPRAIRVLDEADGVERFMVWTGRRFFAGSPKEARVFMARSRGHKTGVGGWPWYVPDVGNANGVPVKVLVTEFAFWIGDPVEGK